MVAKISTKIFFSPETKFLSGCGARPSKVMVVLRMRRKFLGEVGCGLSEVWLKFFCRGVAGLVKMTSKLVPEFTNKRGLFTNSELRILATSLGYDRNLFHRVLRRTGSTSFTTVSERDIHGWLDAKLLDADLNQIFNRYQADYNAKVIKEAIKLLGKRKLTFCDVSSARSSFETMTLEDPRGLQSDTYTVLQALKMTDRIIGAEKLQDVIRCMSNDLETPNRLKLYEFLPLVASAEKIWVCMQEMEEKRAAQRHCTTYSDSSLGDSVESFDVGVFDELFETPYQQLLKFLDERYQASLIKQKKVAKTQPLFKSDSYIHNSESKELLAVSREQKRALTPGLDKTRVQVLQARTGHYIFPCQDTVAVMQRVQQSQQQSRGFRSLRAPLVRPTSSLVFVPATSSTSGKSSHSYMTSLSLSSMADSRKSIN